MACHNHPTVPTAAKCETCGIELCGVCCRFLDSGTYCEKCATAAQARERFVEEEQKRRRAKAAAEKAAIHVTDPEDEQREKRHKQDRAYIWAGMLGATFMLCGSMAVYAFPNLLEDSESLAAMRAEEELEACRQVFEDIGYMLEEGRPPDGTLRCAGTVVPNIVIREGGVVQIAHPNPQMFGLQALYVTSDSHRVVME